MLDSLTAAEMFDEKLAADDILYRLFHEHQVRVVKANEYYFGCRCSREKLLNTLSSMKEDDINAMIEDGKLPQLAISADKFILLIKANF